MESNNTAAVGKRWKRHNNISFVYYYTIRNTCHVLGYQSPKHHQSLMHILHICIHISYTSTLLSSPSTLILIFQHKTQDTRDGKNETQREGEKGQERKTENDEVEAEEQQQQ